MAANTLCFLYLCHGTWESGAGEKKVREAIKQLIVRMDLVTAKWIFDLLLQVGVGRGLAGQHGLGPAGRCRNYTIWLKKKHVSQLIQTKYFLHANIILKSFIKLIRCFTSAVFFFYGRLSNAFNGHTFLYQNKYTKLEGQAIFQMDVQ